MLTDSPCLMMLALNLFKWVFDTYSRPVFVYQSHVG